MGQQGVPSARVCELRLHNGSAADDPAYRLYSVMAHPLHHAVHHFSHYSAVHRPAIHHAAHAAAHAASHHPAHHAAAEVDIVALGGADIRLSQGVARQPDRRGGDFVAQGPVGVGEGGLEVRQVTVTGEWKT